MKLINRKQSHGRALVKIEGRHRNVDIIKNMLRIDWDSKFQSFEVISGLAQQAVWDISQTDINKFRYDFGQLQGACNKMAGKRAT